MTLPALRLGYLVFGTRKPQAWTDFCTRMLGLPGPTDNPDGSQGWQVDDGARQRLVVQGAEQDDLLAIGLECRDDGVLDGLLEQLARDGIRTQAADAAQAAARRVRRLHCTLDPAGNRVDLFTGAEPAAQPFRSDAFPGGFVTGRFGLGHAVLVHRDLDAMEAFYAKLGFRVSERMESSAGGIPFKGTFLYCNERHHSIALFSLPWRRRLHHFMLQAADVVDVARACDRARMAKVPLSLSLGQHDDDGTFSFYGRAPGGFDFEIGAGGRTIDPATHEVETGFPPSRWGHEPQLALKLRVAGAFLTRRVGAPA
jgi:2,3-dihydroxybiphenyl 1,2-dioxygenase